MKYNIDYFIDKFSSIPEDKWCTGALQRNGQSCANGHLGVGRVARDGSWDKSDESVAIRKLTDELDIIAYGQKFEDPAPGYSTKLALVNNGEFEQYQQETPKQRVLAFLYDIKANQAVNEAKNIIETHKIEEYATV